MLVEAVKVSTRDGLVALRDVLAVTITQADPKEVAALARQLQAVLAAIDGLPAAEGANPVDDLKARRAKRRGASGGDVAAKGQQRRKRSG